MNDLRYLNEENWRNLLEMYDDVKVHTAGIQKKTDPILSYYSAYYDWPKFSILDHVDAVSEEIEVINRAIEEDRISPFILVNPIYHGDESLAKEFDRYGIRQIGQWPLICYDLQKKLPVYESPSAFEIRVVSDEVSLLDWLTIVQDVLFESKPVPSLIHDPGMYLLTLGYEKGVPVASVLTYFGSSSASGHMVAVIPAYREKGFGKIMFRHSLATAADRGYSFSFAQSSSMGLKPWLKLGFEISGYVDVMWKVGHTIKKEEYSR